jgi:tetratricopeptide (TPR) repeat protein
LFHDWPAEDAMDTAAEMVESGKAARRAGAFNEALELYGRAAEIYHTDGDLVAWAHTLRHLAELQLKAGDAMAALESIATVYAFYAQNGAAPLELANSFRVRALTHEAVGEPSKAERDWLDASELYKAEGVQAGVDEALAHLTALGVG